MSRELERQGSGSNSIRSAGRDSFLSNHAVPHMHRQGSTNSRSNDNNDHSARPRQRQSRTDSSVDLMLNPNERNSTKSSAPRRPSSISADQVNSAVDRNHNNFANSLIKEEKEEDSSDRSG